MTSSQIHQQHLGEAMIDASVNFAPLRSCGNRVRRIEGIDATHPHANARVYCAIATQAALHLADGPWTQQRRA